MPRRSYVPEGSSLQAVHNAVSPRQITELVEGAGWRLAKGQTVRTPDGEQYAWRETSQILSLPIWDNRVHALNESQKVKAMLFGMKDALKAAVEELDGGIKDLVNMDVWAARFERG